MMVITNFAEDKLRLGNWSELHCSRTCIIFAEDKLWLGNRSVCK